MVYSLFMTFGQEMEWVFFQSQIPQGALFQWNATRFLSSLGEHFYSLPTFHAQSVCMCICFDSLQNDDNVTA